MQLRNRAAANESLSVMQCRLCSARRVMSGKRHNQSGLSASPARCGADCRTQAHPLTFNPVADQTNGGDNSDHEYAQQHGVFDEGCSVFVFSETFENFDGFAHNEISRLEITLILRCERHSCRHSLVSVPAAHLKRIAELNAKIALKFDFESNPFVSINGHAVEVSTRILLIPRQATVSGAAWGGILRGQRPRSVRHANEPS